MAPDAPESRLSTAAQFDPEPALSTGQQCLYLAPGHLRRRSSKVAALHGFTGADQRGHAMPVQSAAQAHALHPRTGEHIERHRARARTYDDIDGLGRHSLHDSAYRVHARQSGRAEHVRSDFSEGHKPSDRVVKVGAALQEVIGPAGEHDAAVRSCSRSAHSGHRYVEFMDRVRRICCRVLDV